MSSDLRRTLRAHSGASVALCAGGMRLCFRIAADGHWRPASSLIVADAEMSIGGGGEVSARGGGALLRDLDEVRRACSPFSFAEEIFGTDAAENLRQTAETFREQIRELPARFGVVASAAEVAEFNRKVAAFDAATAAQFARLARLVETSARQ